jgi:hypothetical protein
VTGKIEQEKPMRERCDLTQAADVWGSHRKNFPIRQVKTFDLQMIMIIIACSWSRDQSIDQETLGRTPGISPHQANHGF